jgi:hypothetical protein
MNLIHIVTPTYKRCQHIRELSQMLSKQVDSKGLPFINFVWYVISDGEVEEDTATYLLSISAPIGYCTPLYYHTDTKEWAGRCCGNSQRKWALDTALHNMVKKLQARDFSLGFDDTDLLLFLNDDNVLNSEALYQLSKPLWDNYKLDWSYGKVKLFDSNMKHYLYQIPRDVGLGSVPKLADICHLNYMVRLNNAIQIGHCSERYEADYDFIQEYNSRYGNKYFVDYLVGIQR